ncbi:hypothetical protein NMY22_g9150 [Coprinellus aureogranulatus]|nr:hypothetical protein NMY22_g9150 [Coprinellus aureogranulatus]
MAQATSSQRRRTGYIINSGCQRSGGRSERDAQGGLRVDTSTKSTQPSRGGRPGGGGPWTGLGDFEGSVHLGLRGTRVSLNCLFGLHDRFLLLSLPFLESLTLPPYHPRTTLAAPASHLNSTHALTPSRPSSPNATHTFNGMQQFGIPSILDSIP